VASALGFIVAVAAAPAGWAHLFWGASVLLLLVAAAARLPLRIFPGRLVLLLPVAAGIGMLWLVRPEGAATFGAALIRATLCLSAMILLANTTSFSEILGVLRRCGIPPLLLTTLALLHRYLFVLLAEADRIRIARQSRTYSRSKRLAWRILGGVAAELFIRSSERAERVYGAMIARGWR
jgi:cobalt/nickel transport system permease protein